MGPECLNGLVGLAERYCDCLSAGAFSASDLVFRQSFEDSEDGILVWTENEGVLPSSDTDTQVWVMKNGVKMQPATYTVGVSQIVIDPDVHDVGAIYEVIVFVSNPSTFSDDVPISDLSSYSQSETGYFLVDSEYGVPLLDAAFANLDCSQSNVWDMLADAREKGIRDFKTDLQQALFVERESGISAYSGMIARAESLSLFPAQERVYGMQLRPKRRMKHASFMLKAVHLGISFTGDVEVTISSNDPDFEEQTVTVAVTADRWARKALDAEIAIPLHKTTQTDLRYNISFQATDGMRVKSNRFYCCSRPAWNNYLDAAGFIATTLDNDHLAAGTNANGIALEGYFTCAKLDWICELEELNGLDFRDLVARCIQYKGAIRAISHILEAGKVNYYSLLKAEDLAKRRAMLSQMYGDNIQWIAQNLPPNFTSCWGCSKRGPKIVSLLS